MMGGGEKGRALDAEDGIRDGRMGAGIREGDRENKNKKRETRGSQEARVVGVRLLLHVEEAPTSTATNDKGKIQSGSNENIDPVFWKITAGNLTHVDTLVL